MVSRVRILAVLAALGLALSGSGASSAPAAQGSPEAPSHGAKSTFVLIKSHGGGGRSMGGGMGRSMGSHMGGSMGHHMGPRMGGSMGPRVGARSLGMRPMRMNGRVKFEGGRHHRRRGRGIFIYGDGYGYDGYDDYGGGSCYWNCRRSGYGLGYCRAYAYNFCD